MQKYIKITQSELFVTLFNKREKSFCTMSTKGRAFHHDETFFQQILHFVLAVPTLCIYMKIFEIYYTRTIGIHNKKRYHKFSDVEILFQSTVDSISSVMLIKI